jgi:succinoglycan biosynthesis protein ExoM
VVSSIDHISVCICTYKRPDLLRQLLEKLQYQETDNLFIYSAVVVDNDINKTAQDTVHNLQKSSAIKIDYYYEPEKNIALARNKAVENAQGSHIAFIDDDEFPVSDWLLQLYKAMHRHKSDGALGPVRPYYPEGCPAWLIKSRLCERPEHQTGTVLHWGETRTGNVLIDRKIFKDPGNRFGREFGRTGGEDIEFFRKMIEAGKIFIWCNEAPTYETVPPERWSKRFYSQRLLRIGGLVGEKIRQRDSITRCFYSLIKSTGWIITMGLSLPFAELVGDHLYMRAVTKIMYNAGLISGLMGRAVIRFRDE